MAETVADFLLKRMSHWGVRRVFGYPGDGINGILGAFSRNAHELEFIQARHEELAAFMACAHAKFTGEVGVCMATSGPGAIHLLNGLYDAKMDHVPVVAIVGQAASSAIGSDYQQEVDLHSLFKDVAHEYVHDAMSPVQVRHIIDRAFRIARYERTVTCLVFPKDLQEMDAVERPPYAHDTAHSSIAYSFPRIVPQQRDLEAAAAILNGGKRVAMLVGAGARRASREVLEIADRTGACIAKALLGRQVVPDTLPFVTGAIGLLGTKPSWDMMQTCDTLLMVGTSFPYAEFLPKPGSARGIQIDIDGRMLGIRYPTELNLVGDAAETLRALVPLLERKDDRSWRQGLEEGVRDWWRLMDERSRTPARPLNPQVVFQELSPKLPDNCILTSDSGSAANWWARHLKLRDGMMASLSGNLATMGPGVPYAIAAKFAFPDRVVIAAVGDGAMQMNGMNGLITIAKYWRKWANGRLIVLVLNNRDLNQVTWEMRVMAGDAKLEASQDLPDVRYSQYAEMLGLRGIFVDGPEQVSAAWDEALASDRPVVYEAYVDPEVPPLPPHITLKQARAFTKSILA
ncbi:MAG TPA: thiamine pyrophosphate-requiring protein, partial [Polyangiaceae bacterium]|nr:thiamine pyrophosphate-requiring protein [Polyangiaceae bacterium]